MTSENQWNRFTEDVPENEPPVLSRVHFDEWSKLYPDSDPESRSRDPAGVNTPLGPFSEIIRAWHAKLAYNPAQIRSLVAIIRGEWDEMSRPVAVQCAKTGAGSVGTCPASRTSAGSTGCAPSP